MLLLVKGYRWLTSNARTGRHTRDMSSDTAQDYPGRPIRPLPRRRLRERLSLEAAGKIVYPPLTSMIKPTFFHPFTTAQEDERPQRQHPTDRARQDEIEHNYISRRNVKDVDSDDDYTELAYRSRYSRHSPDSSGRSYRYVQKPETRNNKPAPPASTTSSADGYDSFENTNNKKKRKIPTPGDAISNGILLQNDLVSLGISTPPNESPLREGDGNRAGQYFLFRGRMTDLRSCHVQAVSGRKAMVHLWTFGRGSQVVLVFKSLGKRHR